MKNHYIIRNEKDKQDFSLSFSKFKLKAPITINIDLFYKKNSNQQLRAYWRLIKVCKSFMNNQGNNFNDEVSRPTLNDYLNTLEIDYLIFSD